jgi:hypothetical protein
MKAQIKRLKDELRVLDSSYRTAQANWDLTLDRAEAAEAAIAAKDAEIERLKAWEPAWRRAAKDLQLALSACERLKAALPDLSHVIAWLEGGCDPLKAAQELRIHAERIKATITPEKNDE